MQHFRCEKSLFYEELLDFIWGEKKQKIAIHTNVANWKNLENIKILQAVKIYYICTGFYSISKHRELFSKQLYISVIIKKNSFKFK